MSKPEVEKPERGKHPKFRELRGYAFDPSLSLKIDTVTINEIVYRVEWEELSAGPVGECVEVIDFDPTVNKFYAPVDLDKRYALAMAGLDPSESNPQFHQQMVYAVAMTTIRNFELALGRKVLWAPRRMAGNSDEYVPRLRIYPHALREANAYYSPEKKALLFGYFQAMPADKTRHMPDALVFTCLSHDIIAHETTHAILDGMYPYYNEPTNPDVLAFHEAFADIVALFQHFTFPEVLKHQIARTRGDLASQNLLGQLAQEFGSAIGSYGSLRDAIGEVDDKNQWKPAEPDPGDYESELEPHARGSILVAAVFEAFINLYKSTVADLLRIASGGTGVLHEGELHPDLVNRLAGEAARCSQRVLSMCIRALDYCPPVDLTFGEFLRGIITADLDLMGDDQPQYRLAFIEAFRRRGIYPSGIKALGVDSVAYPKTPSLGPDADGMFQKIGEFLRDYRGEVQYLSDRQKLFEQSAAFSGGTRGLHGRLADKLESSPDFQRVTGMAWIHGWESVGVSTSPRTPYVPSFWIQNLRLVSRVGARGTQTNNIVFSIVQRAGVKMVGDHLQPVLLDEQRSADDDTMIFRGGCTFVFDLDTVQLKYVIAKPIIDVAEQGAPRLDEARARKQYTYQFETGPMHMSEFRQYFGLGFTRGINEPFAVLHQQ